MERQFLRPDVVLRPLVNRWPAWDALLPPQSLARHVVHSHVPRLESYLESPASHVEMANDPMFAGGPWVNVPPERAREIEALLATTKREQRPLLELDEAITTLDELLRREGRGQSLEPLYSRIPEPLKGFVQLVYDLNDSPCIFFHEGLLYRSSLYALGRQSFVLGRISGDLRPFQWSTPILEDEGQLELPMEFAAPEIDALSSMRVVPRGAGELAELLRCDVSRLAPLLTVERPRSPEPPPNDGVRVRYFGHACVLIEAGGISILTDPFVSLETGGSVPRFTIQDLPEKIDYVVITHCHSDHIELETLLALRPRVRNVVVPRAGGARREDPNLRLMLRRIGFRSVIEVHDMEELVEGCVRITTLPFLGEHGDLDIQGKATYLVEALGRRFFFVADSTNLDITVFRRIGSMLEDVDVMFIGMECEGAPMTWGYGALFTRSLENAAVQTRRDRASNCDEAMEMVRALRPGKSVVYAMGKEPWMSHIMGINQSDDTVPARESARFVEVAKSEGYAAEKPYGKAEYLFSRG